jgi:SAM-dependent methyltransferase
MTKVVKNEYGFYEVAEKPSPEALQAYYAEKYYQTSQGSYEKSYSPAEQSYFRAKIEQKHLVAKPHVTLAVDRSPRFLDVGCGEGWSLAYFAEAGWDCIGLDYSDFGCKNQNPRVVECLRVGDIYNNLATLAQAGERFDLILLDNVLEHVIDPGALLVTLRSLLNPQGALVVEVPNDFSPLQQHLLEAGHIDTPFWIVVPDHLSYFGAEGLTALAEAMGWSVQGLMTDYPIDLGLVNPHTNYIKDRSVGKATHLARVEIENLIHKLSPEKAVALYSALADLGLGRALTAVLTPQ